MYHQLVNQIKYRNISKLVLTYFMVQAPRVIMCYYIIMLGLKLGHK